MLPPVEPAVFERNPNFEVLYKDLCARKLNVDGSTRDTKKQRMHAEIRQVRQNAEPGSLCGVRFEQAWGLERSHVSG